MAPSLLRVLCAVGCCAVFARAQAVPSNLVGVDLHAFAATLCADGAAAVAVAPFLLPAAIAAGGADGGGSIAAGNERHAHSELAAAGMRVLLLETMCQRKGAAGEPLPLLSAMLRALAEEAISEGPILQPYKNVDDGQLLGISVVASVGGVGSELLPRPQETAGDVVALALAGVGGGRPKTTSRKRIASKIVVVQKQRAASVKMPQVQSLRDMVAVVKQPPPLLLDKTAEALRTFRLAWADLIKLAPLTPNAMQAVINAVLAVVQTPSFAFFRAAFAAPAARAPVAAAPAPVPPAYGSVALSVVWALAARHPSADGTKFPLPPNADAATRLRAFAAHELLAISMRGEELGGCAANADVNANANVAMQRRAFVRALIGTRESALWRAVDQGLPGDADLNALVDAAAGAGPVNAPGDGGVARSSYLQPPLIAALVSGNQPVAFASVDLLSSDLLCGAITVARDALVKFQLVKPDAPKSQRRELPPTSTANLPVDAEKTLADWTVTVPGDDDSVLLAKKALWPIVGSVLRAQLRQLARAEADAGADGAVAVVVGGAPVALPDSLVAAALLAYARGDAKTRYLTARMAVSRFIEGASLRSPWQSRSLRVRGGAVLFSTKRVKALPIGAISAFLLPTPTQDVAGGVAVEPVLAAAAVRVRALHFCGSMTAPQYKGAKNRHTRLPMPRFSAGIDDGDVDLSSLTPPPPPLASGERLYTFCTPNAVGHPNFQKQAEKLATVFCAAAHARGAFYRFRLETWLGAWLGGASQRFPLIGAGRSSISSRSSVAEPLMHGALPALPERLRNALREALLNRRADATSFDCAALLNKNSASQLPRAGPRSAPFVRREEDAVSNDLLRGTAPAGDFNTVAELARKVAVQMHDKLTQLQQRKANRDLIDVLHLGIDVKCRLLAWKTDDKGKDPCKYWRDSVQPLQPAELTYYDIAQRMLSATNNKLSWTLDGATALHLATVSYSHLATIDADILKEKFGPSSLLSIDRADNLRALALTFQGGLTIIAFPGNKAQRWLLQAGATWRVGGGGSGGLRNNGMLQRARAFVARIRTLHPGTAISLAGECMGGALAMQLSRELLVPSVVFNPAAVSTTGVSLFLAFIRGGKEGVYKKLATTTVEAGDSNKPALITIHANVGDMLPAAYFQQNNYYTLRLYPLISNNLQNAHNLMNFFALTVSNDNVPSTECKLPEEATQESVPTQTALRLAQCTIDTVFPSSPFVKRVRNYLSPALSMEQANTMAELDAGDSMKYDYNAALNYFKVYVPGTEFDVNGEYGRRIDTSRETLRRNVELVKEQAARDAQIARDLQ
jgi:hypothetical protein